MREHIHDYLNTLATMASKMKAHSAEIEALAQLVKKTKRMGGKVFIIGNGGSASTADHFACDFSKTINAPALSLQGTAVITAISNDIDYSMIYRNQLSRLSSTNDLLIAISTSGNSQNIIEAVEYARGSLMDIATLTAFNGGWLRGKGNVNIHVDTDIIEIAEDIHAAILHCIVWMIKGGM